MLSIFPYTWSYYTSIFLVLLSVSRVINIRQPVKFNSIWKKYWILNILFFKTWWQGWELFFQCTYPNPRWLKMLYIWIKMNIQSPFQTTHCNFTSRLNRVLCRELALGLQILHPILRRLNSANHPFVNGWGEKRINGKQWNSIIESVSWTSIDDMPAKRRHFQMTRLSTSKSLGQGYISTWWEHS